MRKSVRVCLVRSVCYTKMPSAWRALEVVMQDSPEVLGGSQALQRSGPSSRFVHYDVLHMMYTALQRVSDREGPADIEGKDL